MPSSCLLAQEVAHEGIGLARSRAVADGDGAHVVLAQQRLQLLRRRLGFALGTMQVDHVVRKEFARLIDHRDLAARAQAGVDAQHGNRPGGRRKQQVVQIVAKDLNRFRIGALL